MEVQHYEPYNPIFAKKKSNASMNGFSTSSSSIDSNEGQARRMAVMWILKLRKKLSVARDTIYAAISILNRFADLGYELNDSNYECICSATIMISAKMNEIYPPKMTSLIYRSSKDFTKQDLIKT